MKNIVPQPWDPEEDLALMNRLNISKSILSMSSPGTNLSPKNTTEARLLTRQCNIELSQYSKQYPDRFSFFASLPLPDIDGALDEIDYARNTLGAVGFQILTNAHGVYPGDEIMAPVWDKLNEKQTIVFLHPTSTMMMNQDGDIEPVIPNPRYPRPMLEFMFDATRAFTTLLLSGTAKRCENITFIGCHCGSAIPPLLDRVVGVAALMPDIADDPVTAETARSLIHERFYFDLAGFPFPDQIHGLLRLTNASRLLYGSDYPYTNAAAVEQLARTMDDELSQLFSEKECGDIYSGNSEILLDLGH